MELPSKELLEEVLGLKISSFDLYPDAEAQILGTGYFISLTTVKGVGKAINIYELVHLMKEWAIKLDKQYELVSYIKNSGKGMCEVYETWYNNVEYGDYQYDTVEETEFKAVTKACEWILEQKELK